MINTEQKQTTPHDAVRLRRLRYRSWHRGCKETDLILGPFSDNGLETLSDLDLYEKLLDEDDADIWEWIIGKTQTPDEYTALLELLKTWPKN